MEGVCAFSSYLAVLFLKSLEATGKEMIKLLFTRAKLFISRQPRLKCIALAALARFPAMARYMGEKVQPGIMDLTPRTRHIYADLKMAIESRSKESR